MLGAIYIFLSFTARLLVVFSCMGFMFAKGVLPFEDFMIQLLISFFWIPLMFSILFRSDELPTVSDYGYEENQSDLDDLFSINPFFRKNFELPGNVVNRIDLVKVSRNELFD